MAGKKEKVLAKCRDFDFGIEDHGCPYLFGTFEYEGGACQGFGYIVDTAFLMRFISVFGVQSLREVNGKSCWVTSDWDGIYKVEPLHKKDGQAFNVEDWRKWHKERGCKASPHEMLTGEKPK
jgi:hypothetical protein